MTDLATVPEAAAPEPQAEASGELKTALVALMPSLRAFARSLCPNPAHADDLVQDSLVKALANIGRFEPGSNLRAWLFTILRNTYYSDLRKRRREVEDADGVHAIRLAEGPNQIGAVDFEDFKAAFARLGEDHRQVLTLVGVLGVSYEEAAEVCGCAVGTVKSRVNRARVRLAELLGTTPEETSIQVVAEKLPHGLISGHV